jgi:hypothetical protein
VDRTDVERVDLGAVSDQVLGGGVQHAGEGAGHDDAPAREAER